MNQTISVIMALIMALTGICGSLGDLNVTEPVSVEVGFGIDGDFAAMVSGDQSEAVVSAIPKILDALSLRAAVDPSAFQLELRAEGGSLLSIALQKQEDGWAIASGILPNTVITVSQETLDQTMQQITSSFSSGEGDAPASIGDILSKIDFQAILAAFGTAWNDLQDSLEAKYGGMETGTFKVNGVDYTQKAVCDITVPELREMIKGAFEKFLADESVAAAFSALGQQVPPASNFDFMANVPDEADLSITRYADEAENSCTEVLLAREDAGLSLWFAQAGSIGTVTFLMNQADAANVDAILTVDREKENYDLDISAAGNGQAMHIKAGCVTVEEGANVNIFATVPVPEHDPVTVRADLKLRHEAPVFEAPEDATVIEMEKIMSADEETAAELANFVANDFKAGVITTVARLFVLLPDLASLIDFSSMLPVTVTVETPDGEPVEVEEKPAEEVTVEESSEEAPEEVPEEIPSEEAPSEETPVDGAAA